MLNAAIWGVGRWGQTLVDSVQGKSDVIRFTDAVARTPAKYEEFARSRGLRLHDDPAAVLDNPDVDALVIATANSQHASHVREAAAAGKHAFVEKPFGLDADDARRAVECCEGAGVTLAVGFNRRFLPSMRDLRAMVEEGELGTMLHVEGQFSGPSGLRIAPGFWRGTVAEAPGGGMTARGIHTLDAMIAICGRVSSVFATSQRRVLDIDLDDTTAALLKFESGVSAYLGTLMATGEYWRLHVFGSRGWAEMRGEGRLIVGDLDGRETVRDYERFDIERAELEAFARAVGGGAAFPVPPQEAVHGTAVLEALVRSAERGEVAKVAD